MIFDKQFFQKFDYTERQLEQFFKNAQKDYQLSKSASNPSIKYRICYDAILKLGVAIIAKNGYKTRSIPGHHVKIIDTLGKILELDTEIFYLHKTRKKRNIDLYDGGVDFSKKEAESLLQIADLVFKRA